jgi:hypothetical protein
VHFWIVEHYAIQHHSKEEQVARRKLIDRFIGPLTTMNDEPIETSPRGVKRPDWFRDTTIADVEQLTRMAPRRRNR